MRFTLVLTTVISFLVHHVLSSSALGRELVELYSLYKMECIAVGPGNTRIIGDNQDIPTPDHWLKPKQGPVHPRPQGTGKDGMLTFFEFEKDLVDPDRIKNRKSTYDMTDMSGGRNTINPDGEVIASKIKGWNFGAIVPWRLSPDIYKDILNSWNDQITKGIPKGKRSSQYTGTGMAQKMGQVLQDTRTAFEKLPNKAELSKDFEAAFDDFKKNLDAAIMHRRFDNAEATIKWYEKHNGWSRSDLAIEKQHLPDGTEFEELDTDKTIAKINGDQKKLNDWHTHTAALSDPSIKNIANGDFKDIVSHTSVIQALQMNQSAAKAPPPGC